MCQKKLWCYVCVLTLLELSLNTKLLAQGKSHDVTIQDSLRGGQPLQEWERETWGEGIGSMENEDEGEAIDGVSLEPHVLRFGHCALAVPHSRTVTLINMANSTLHLASVAGTTPDFHASFFESKTLAPLGNTSFTVVYLGRREGPASARLYIHTSLGVHKYAVSAVGVSSEYEVWPLVGVRVPLNATVDWELRLHNPSPVTVQVTEVYSSGSWLSLSLPGGEASAGSTLWSVPPRHTRPLVRMRIAPAPGAPQPLTAYVRVRADIPGGGLVLPVEARSVPAGEHARPLHVRLRARGSGDPPHTVEVEMANSGGMAVRLEGGVRATCGTAPPPDPCALQPRRANGANPGGAQLTLLDTQLGPHDEFKRVARLTLDYGELWRLAVANGAGAGGGGGAGAGAWCAGCVRLGGAALPYSVRVLPGALLLRPPQLHLVTSEGDAALEPREVVAHNEFQTPLLVEALQVPHRVEELFTVVDHTPKTIGVGESAVILQLRLKEAGATAEQALDELVVVHTNLSQYHLPLRLFSGKLVFEWEWGDTRGGVVDLGTLGTSASRRVGVRVHNPAPLPLCVTRVSAALSGAAAALVLPAPLPYCIEPGSTTQAWLTVVAPAREGQLRGELALHTPHARCAHALTLRVRAGRLRAHALRLPLTAPYTLSSAELVVNNSMAVRMRVLTVDQTTPDPALVYEPLKSTVEAGGVQALGRVRYEPERACRPACYTGLRLDEPKGKEWWRRESQHDVTAMRADLALLEERLEAYGRAAAVTRNVTLVLRTDEVAQLSVSGTVRAQWPRLVAAGAGCAGRVGVRAASTLVLPLRNPATVPLVLSARLPDDAGPSPLPTLAGSDSTFCESLECSWSRRAFNLTGWRVTKGTAWLWRDGAAGPVAASGGAARGGGALPPLLLAPQAELELTLVFAPPEPAELAANLYLRNNLTIVEAVQLYGEGEYPTFEVGGRRPGSDAPFTFEVKECLWSAGVGSGGGVDDGAAGVMERAVPVRNTGRVGVRLTRWGVAGGGCAERGFRLRPCGALVVPPAAQAPLHLAFTPDYTLGKVVAPLRAYTVLGPVEYTLTATIPARVLAECAAAAPRPPWEGALRALGVTVALAALALVLAAGALDAERLLRRARAARASSPPRAPLDLRSLAPPAPPPAVRAPSRRRKAPRRAPAALDAQAERRAFERWRTEVLRRDDESSRSSEDDTAASMARASPTPSDEHPAEIETETRTPTPPTDDDGDDRDDGREVAPHDEDVGTSVSDGSNLSNASTPIEEQEDADDCYAGDAEPDTRDDSPADGFEIAPEPKNTQELSRSSPPQTACSLRGRRETSEPVRRAERTRVGVVDSERRTALVRPHARKERSRRRERVPPSPSTGAGTEGGCEAGGEARGSVRWGASWSSVVAGEAGGAVPLPPIGSDVRRREAERADQSLFYFNGGSEQRQDGFAWQPPRQTYLNGTRDYIDECSTLSTTGMPGGWWGGSWSAWGAAGTLRPPPGFAAPPPPQRPFDPFRSLASIWAPAPHDWRMADEPGATHAPPPMSAPGTPHARASPDDELK